MRGVPLLKLCCLLNELKFNGFQKGGEVASVLRSYNLTVRDVFQRYCVKSSDVEVISPEVFTKVIRHVL